MSCRGYNFQYFYFDENAITQIAEIVAQKHYPHRIPPDKWPDMKLTGKAIVKGWAVPCRYYPRPWRRGGHCLTFVFPGISDQETQWIHAIMKRGWLNDR